MKRSASSRLRRRLAAALAYLERPLFGALVTWYEPPLFSRRRQLRLRDRTQELRELRRLAHLLSLLVAALWILNGFPGGFLLTAFVAMAFTGLLLLARELSWRSPSRVLLSKQGVLHEGDGQGLHRVALYREIRECRLVFQKFEGTPIHILMLETKAGAAFAFGAPRNARLHVVVDIFRRHGIPVRHGWGTT